jgi:hypothetical protein
MSLFIEELIASPYNKITISCSNSKFGTVTSYLTEDIGLSLSSDYGSPIEQIPGALGDATETANKAARSAQMVKSFMAGDNSAQMSIKNLWQSLLSYSGTEHFSLNIPISCPAHCLVLPASFEGFPVTL